MAIVGDRPESGVRLELERGKDGPPWIYEGHAVVPDGRHPMRAVVTAEGEVTVGFTSAGEPVESHAADSALEALESKAKLIVRAAYRHAKDDGAAPPRRIVRWRGEK